MAAHDFFHETVKSALVKDGWTITDDPLRLSVGDIDFYVDYDTFHTAPKIF